MQPVLFLSHGSPDLLLQQTPLRTFLEELGTRIKTNPPKAILVFSAHFEAKNWTIVSGKNPETLHDFYGFPDELYDMTYPAPGDPHLAEEIQKRLTENGISSILDEHRPWDHGVWSPLKLLFPEANIPIVQISLKKNFSEDEHFALGKALQDLRNEGVLCIGSASTTHNLGGMPKEMSKAFADYVTTAVESGDTRALKNWRTKAPFAALAHPREEHFFPLFVCLGLAGESQGKKIHESFVWESINLSCYGWGM